MFKKLLATAFLFALVSFFPTAGMADYPDFPWVDCNNDGAYDSGDSGDVSEMILSDGIFSTEVAEGAYTPCAGPASLIIPSPLKTKKSTGFYLAAGQDVFIGGSLTATKGGANIIIRADEGSIMVEKRVTIKADDIISLGAKGNIVMNPSAKLFTVDKDGIGVVSLRSTEGDIVMDHGQIKAYRNIMFFAGGEIRIDGRSKLMAKEGVLRIDGGGNITVNDTRIAAETAYVLTQADMVDFQDNNVYVSGTICLSAANSTVDIRGTDFDLDESGRLLINADNVLE